MIKTPLSKMRANKLIRFFTRNINLIESTLRNRMDIRALEIQDESANHMEADDSHFRLYLASKDFDGLTLIKR